jgi:hypothetical protein
MAKKIFPEIFDVIDEMVMNIYAEPELKDIYECKLIFVKYTNNM